MKEKFQVTITLEYLVDEALERTEAREEHYWRGLLAFVQNRLMLRGDVKVKEVKDGV